MEHLFVGGAYFMMDNGTIESYKIIAEMLEKQFKNYKIYTPLDIEEFRQNYIKNNPNSDKNIVDSAMVEYDLNLVKNSKLFVVDVILIFTGDAEIECSLKEASDNFTLFKETVVLAPV